MPSPKPLAKRMPPAPRGRSPRGRPRDERATQAILEVTLRHFGRYGYAGLSLDAIAAEAGVTKPGLYRRWASKEDLVTAAVSEWRNRGMPQFSGDVEADLAANLRQIARMLNEPPGLAMIAALLLQERTKPELMKLFRERNFAPRREALRKILRAAKAQGALPTTLDVDTVIAMLLGAYHLQLIMGEPIPASWPRELMKVLFSSKVRMKK